MKKVTFTLLALLVAAVSTQAKSWKIGPASVTGMDFASINAAVNSSNVSAGDTLYLDQYYNENQEQNVTKRVVIIGTGYDTSFTDEQVVATLTRGLSLKTNNAIIKSLRLNCSVNFYASNCVLDRCCIANGIVKTQSTTAGINCLYSCYLSTSRIEGYSSTAPSMYDIQNCIIIDNGYASNPYIHNIAYLTSSIINNNVIYKSYRTGGWECYCLSNIDNSRITNNMIYGRDTYNDNYANRDFANNVVSSGSGNTIEHNIFSGTAALTYYPNNKTGQRNNWNNFFEGTGNYSDYYKLATESGDNPAIGYATDGGDCGAHGGMFGCPSGGRPQYIPYFSKVVVGSRTENGKLPVSVTVKIQDE